MLAFGNEDDKMRNSTFEKPPEGVVVGESVPRENGEDDVEETEIRKIMNKLKARGEPWISMREEELREKALEIYNEVFR